MGTAGMYFQLSRFLKNGFIQTWKKTTHTMFHKHLLLTNVGISGGLSCAGDMLQQHYEIIHNRKKVEWDKMRTFRMTVSGIAVGVVCHYWYHFLDNRYPGRTFKTVMKKVFIDQMVCSPLYISIMFVTTCYMENATWSRFKTEIKEKWWRLYIAEWVVWPPAQVINFYILPPQYRVLYDNTISLGYDCYTSYVKHEIPIEGKDKKDDS